MNPTSFRTGAALVTISAWSSCLVSAQTILQYSFGQQSGDVASSGPVPDGSGCGNVGVVLLGNGGTYSTDIPAADRRRFTFGTASLNLGLGSLATDAGGMRSGIPLRIDPADSSNTLSHQAIADAGGLTMEMWVRGAADSQGLAISLQGAMNFRVGYGQITFLNGFNSTGPSALYDPTKWTHVAGVIDNPRLNLLGPGTMVADMSLYINGALVSTWLDARFLADLTRAAAIGNHPLATSPTSPINEPFGGLVYEPRISLAALSPDALTVVPASQASWTVINLNPAGSYESFAYAADARQQVGYAFVNRVSRASLWSGTARSWVDLHPAGAQSSIAAAVSGGKQAGYVFIDADAHASLWSGTAASWVDLSPEGSTSSAAFAICGGQQAGYARVGGVDRASLWSGTADSWVDLNPAGSWYSIAYAVGGGQQAGSAEVDGVLRASLWSGTAASWVDISPAGSTESNIFAISGGQQAGYAVVDEVTRASLWSGTAASWVDLSPEGSSLSVVTAIDSGYQVGYAVIDDGTRASLWSGSADSWVDLSALLPPWFVEAYAMGISSDGVNTYVAGGGFNALTGRNEALLWMRPNPTPACPADVVADGSVDGNDFVAFINSFAIGDVTVDPVADLDHDGTIDGNDFVAFINAFGVGC